MSQNYPAASTSVPTSRPRTATAGAIIAIVMSGLGLLACILVLIVAAVGGDSGDPKGRTGAAVLFSVLLPLTLIGVVAAVMALRNSNGWRVTTVVFGFVVGGFWACATIGAFLSNGRGAVAGGIVLLLLAAFSIASAVLLLVNGASQFYSSGKPVVAAYVAPGEVAPGLPPAGWYPVDGARLRWWSGTQWSEHFHDGHSHDGHSHDGHDGRTQDGVGHAAQ